MLLFLNLDVLDIFDGTNQSVWVKVRFGHVKILSLSNSQHSKQLS